MRRLASLVVLFCFSIPTVALAGPRWSAEDARREQYREQARVSHGEAMEQLKVVLAEHGADMAPEVRGEALFRLADLQWQESRYHLEHPYTLHLERRDLEVRYNSGDSDSHMFGGNSN